MTPEPSSPVQPESTEAARETAAMTALIADAQREPGVIYEADPLPPKPWWKSKTVQGAIVVLGGLIGRQAMGAAAPSEAELGQLIDLAATLLGVVLVIIGRATATRPLK